MVIMKIRLLVGCLVLSMIFAGCGAGKKEIPTSMPVVVEDTKIIDESVTSSEMSMPVLADEATESTKVEEQDTQPIPIETVPMHQCNLNKYVTYSLWGENNEGYITVEFNKELFFVENISNIAFKSVDAERAYRELYGYKDSEPIACFYRWVEIEPSKDQLLSNGEFITLFWNIDETKVNVYFDINYECQPITVVVQDLPEMQSRSNLAVVLDKLKPRVSPSLQSIELETELDVGDLVQVMRIEPLGDIQWVYCKYGWIPSYYLDMSNVSINNP